MNWRCAIVLSLAALTFTGGARADQSPAHIAVGAIIQTAAVTHEIARLASNVTVMPETPAQAEIAMPVPADLAGSFSARASNRRHEKVAPPEALCVRPIGEAESGTAAWYGGRYLGRRTSSGSRLDTIHPTAAHRTLPLNSLARVTNLDNGRSVVVRVTDRGPVSKSLLIDMSPKAADELHMRHAGLVPVTVEQVVEVPTDSK